MKARKQKLAILSLAILALCGATLLVLNAFQSNIVFFFSPTEVSQGKAPANTTFRIGGLVEQGTVHRSADGLNVEFRITDLVQSLPVAYRGILPDLFREGQGVVAQGKLVNGRFQAEQVLAKHDENYMPPEAAAALEQAAKTLKAE
ncbi:MAG: cytochrome c maturation protein CcmE [Granulosicoccaceae bacterium]|jgi:cytochrome c-type biogenesis protein CcmE